LASEFTEPQTEKCLECGSVDQSVSINRLRYGCLPNKYIGETANKAEINAREMKRARGKDTWIENF
jgi:hypothetical protein